MADFAPGPQVGGDCVHCSGKAVADGVIWHRKLTRQMALTTHLLLAGVDDVTRDVTGRQDDRRRLMAFYGVSAVGMLLLMLPVIVTSARGTTDSLVVYARTMQRRSREIKVEKRKTEKLLNEMLPKSVAYRLRKGEQVMMMMMMMCFCFFNGPLVYTNHLRMCGTDFTRFLQEAVL